MAIACGAPNGRTGTGNWRQQRHNAIRDLIAKIARQAGLQIAVERDMLPGIHPGIRADVILYDFPRRGTHTAVDVMVKALFGGRDQSLFTCAAAAGHMAAAGEREKAVHYRGLAEPYTLTPAVIEQYGRCGRLADELLNELADHRTAKLLSAPREGITEHPMYNRVKGPLFEHWKRAFSFALYKQTVECIHHGVTPMPRLGSSKATGPTATAATSTMRTWSRRSAATTTTPEHCPKGQRLGVVAVRDCETRN